MFRPSTSLFAALRALTPYCSIVLPCWDLPSMDAGLSLHSHSALASPKMHKCAAQSSLTYTAAISCLFWHCSSVLEPECAQLLPLWLGPAQCLFIKVIACPSGVHQA